MSTSRLGGAGGAFVLMAWIVSGGAILTATEAALAGRWLFAFEFATPTTLSFAGIASPRCTAVGDIDEDGTVDLVIAGSDEIDDPEDGNSVWLMRGVGAGQFAAPEPILVTAEPSLSIRWLVTAELTGDSHLDLAVVSIKWLWVLRGDGRGNFVLIEHLETGEGHRQLVAADFDADGDTDLAATDHFGDHAWVRYNDGAGHFPMSFSWVMPDAHFMVAADLNDDDLTDLAIVQNESFNVAIVLNTDSGWELPTTITVPDIVPTGIVAADFDEDGDTDLVVAGIGSIAGMIKLLENVGGGEFVESQPILLPPVLLGGAPWFLAAADFNGDGLLDLALTEALSNAVKVFPNEGSESLAFGMALPLQAGGFPYSLAAANLDNDCDVDLVVANVAGQSISIILNQTSKVQTCAVADLNVDAVVDMADVAVVVSAWGEHVSPADLNYDGVVNGFDLATVLGLWDPTR